MTSNTGDGPSISTSRFSRRRALSSVVTAGLSLPLLSACGDGSSTTGSTATDPTSDAADPSKTPTTGSTEAPPSGVVADALAPTADIPVGSGAIFADSRVVVTQPDAGEFKCFSAVCTHSGCLVSEVTSTILCTCHGSSFDISTGEVLGGPAVAPLPAVDFTIEKDQVVLS